MNYKACSYWYKVMQGVICILGLVNNPKLSPLAVIEPMALSCGPQLVRALLRKHRAVGSIPAGGLSIAFFTIVLG